MTDKLCPDCQSMKATSEFHKDKSKRDGLNLYCKPCMIIRQRAYVSRPGIGTAKDGMKRCSHCKETKPVADYSNAARSADGLDKRCRACLYLLHKGWREKNLTKVAAHQKKWRENNRERSNDHGLKYRYGLEIGRYNEMLQQQNGRCAICKREAGEMRFHVDHCHDTSRIRGLLCHGCNVSIGHFRHDPEILRSAILYLELLPEGG